MFLLDFACTRFIENMEKSLDINCIFFIPVDREYMHWVHLLSGRPPVRIWPGVPYKTPQDGEFPHPAVFFAA